jgi:hypothetical protein
MDESSRFIDEEIEGRFARKPGPPTSFVWQGREYEIVEIERGCGSLTLDYFSYIIAYKL